MISLTNFGENLVNNVLGTPLESCCTDPITGFFRDGYCRTHGQDFGKHWLCAVMTDEFLQYSKACGNDLITAKPEYDFVGLKAGDAWCLCTLRWLEALEAGCAPPLKLRACHHLALTLVDIEILSRYALADG